MKKYLPVAWIVASPFLLLLIMIFAIGYYCSSARLVVINDSGKPLSGRLLVSQTTYKIEKMKPGMKKIIWYEKCRFSGHQVLFHSGSGESFAKDLGSIGLDSPTREIIIVKPSSVEQINDKSF